jgi:serine/threonine protein kinase/tetratricopeptide (TPR) repeat protein
MNDPKARDETRTTLTEPRSDLTPDRIGHYKLLQKLGEGGCGTVYLAEQEEPVVRRVALKVIKLGMDTKEVIARFEAERQALALMDHPNIAKVLDAGTTENGRPYFVMELVQGVPITAFCDERKLSTAARLELVTQVCHAVQHAHQKGIIHRDIKPSNILVALHDDAPMPKVIDFGIAKATAGRLTDQTLFTAVEQFIGTPAYMSPEQAQVSVVDIDTRSDIYSLGVLLYELLTGRTPFDTAELLKVGLDEMRRHIREVDPPRPSTRLSTLHGEALSTTAQCRQVHPPKLINLVRGDLDWIVMRCLEKDRTRRYETANGLAADIQHHLCDEPIAARSPSTVYVLKKLFRRHRLMVSGAAAFLALWSVGTVVSAYFAARAVRSESEAELSAVTVTQLFYFIGAMFGQYEKLANDGGEGTAKPELTLKQALDRASKQLRSEDDFAYLRGPRNRGEIARLVGELYQGTGDYEQAILHFERALALRKKAFGANHVRTLEYVGPLTEAYWHAGRLAEAATFLEQSLINLRREFGANHVRTLEYVVPLAETYRRAGRLAEAATLLEQSLIISRREFGTEHSNTLKSANSLAYANYSQGKFAEAAALFAQTLEIQKRALGPKHPETLTSMSNLAHAFHSQGKAAEAAALHARTLEIRRRVHGPEHPDTLTSMNSLASAYQQANDFPRAETVFRDLLAIHLRKDGADSTTAATTRVGLGKVLLAQQKFADAEPVLREALVVREKKLPDNWLIFNARSLLGGAMAGQKKFADAEPLLVSGYEGMRQREAKISTLEKVRLQEALKRLVQLYTDWGKPDQAAEWQKKLDAFNAAAAKKQPPK